MFPGCSEKPVSTYYEHSDVIITRIDKGNEIFVYYGEVTKEMDFPMTFIKIEYSGLNSGMQAYLNFLPNKKVEMIGIMGIFEKMGNDNRINIKEIDNIRFIAWKDSINGDYKNTMELSNIFKIEKERNKLNHSVVKAVY